MAIAGIVVLSNAKDLLFAGQEHFLRCAQDDRTLSTLRLRSTSTRHSRGDDAGKTLAATEILFQGIEPSMRDGQHGRMA